MVGRRLCDPMGDDLDICQVLPSQINVINNWRLACKPVDNTQCKIVFCVRLLMPFCIVLMTAASNCTQLLFIQEILFISMTQTNILWGYCCYSQKGILVSSKYHYFFLSFIHIWSCHMFISFAIKYNPYTNKVWVKVNKMISFLGWLSIYSFWEDIFCLHDNGKA